MYFVVCDSGVAMAIFVFLPISSARILFLISLILIFIQARRVVLAPIVLPLYVIFLPPSNRPKPRKFKLNSDKLLKWKCLDVVSYKKKI